MRIIEYLNVSLSYYRMLQNALSTLFEFCHDENEHEKGSASCKNQ